MLAEPLTPAAPATAAERAYAALRGQVLDGTLPAGTMALEGELAAALGLSRTPVRQALVRLADEGLIALRPRHGMRVRPIAADDMREIYQVLTALEATAARLCAERGLPAAELDALDASVAEMDLALAAGDLPRWAAADAAFHRRLVAASGNRRLAATVAGVRRPRASRADGDVAAAPAAHRIEPGPPGGGGFHSRPRPGPRRGDPSRPPKTGRRPAGRPARRPAGRRGVTFPFRNRDPA